MRESERFEKRIKAAFLATLLFALLIAGSSFFTSRFVNGTHNALVSVNVQELIEAEHLWMDEERAVSASRGFLIAGDRDFLLRFREEEDQFQSDIDKLDQSGRDSEEQELLSSIVNQEGEHRALLEKIAGQKRSGKDVVEAFETDLMPKRNALKNSIDRLVRKRRIRLKESLRSADAAATRSQYLMFAISIVALLLSGTIALVIGKLLTGQFREAVSARQLSDEFVAIASHDLKNPLGSIVMCASLLRNDSEEEVKRERLLDIIERSARHMNTLVNGILDIHKIELGKLSIFCQTCDARALIGEAIDMLAPIAIGRSIELSSEFEPKNIKIACDPERILQVLSNLIGNALKFTPNGGTVKIRVDEQGPMARICVCDSGKGLTPDEIRHVFDRYWQAPETSNLGLGLGLAIVRGIVEQHGGETWIESDLGSGSRVYFTLPLAKRREATKNLNERFMI